MTDEDAVLAANQAFYAAFAGGDMAAMEALWAITVPVACVHPGWQALTARDQVLDSWRAILGAPPPIRMVGAQATMLRDAAFVICTEKIQDTALVATNIFVREDPGWKMVHHQAGHVMARPAPAPGPAKPDNPTVH